MHIKKMKDRNVRQVLSRDATSGRGESKWKGLKRENMVNVLCMLI
jgi:hypothetical protein